MKTEFTYKVESWEPVKINPYKCPHGVTGPIDWILGRATCKAHRKYLATCLILGQPFFR